MMYCFTERIKIDAAEPEEYFYLSHSFFHSFNMPSILPTMLQRSDKLFLFSSLQTQLMLPLETQMALINFFFPHVQ